jgi:hypothetical protein
MAVTADYDTQSAVERELVLRLASLLWRLRRATAIESGLFRIQARHLLQFRQGRRAHQNRQKIIDAMYRDANPAENDARQDDDTFVTDQKANSVSALADQDVLTHSFIRLINLPTYPLDRLSRYEGSLWRQACQILFTLQCLERRRPWQKLRLR